MARITRIKGLLDNELGLFGGFRGILLEAGWEGGRIRGGSGRMVYYIQLA